MSHKIIQYRLNDKEEKDDVQKYNLQYGCYFVDCIKCDCDHRPYSHCHMCPIDKFNIKTFTVSLFYVKTIKKGKVRFHEKRSIKFHYVPKIK